ncbi:hypothetical protein J2S36_000247 [Arcanobacterium hippocoleae]|uniref:Uncharacterized protein n=1 Tax=Arcanobacterium hippocoleae TaxID=149017 RepID=A0ABU1T084_9ACTO|nr:hypothetical protein [Arcanobacterium hippocoleae]
MKLRKITRMAAASICTLALSFTAVGAATFRKGTYYRVRR